jgi:ATP/maltotriose-dependent transcriptional regulator MalT
MHAGYRPEHEPLSRDTQITDVVPGLRFSTRELRFSTRQLQVVGMIAAGLSNDEIGSRLTISARTVRMHSDALRIKLGVNHRRQIPGMYRLLTGHDPHEAGASVLWRVDRI